MLSQPLQLANILKGVNAGVDMVGQARHLVEMSVVPEFFPRPCRKDVSRTFTVLILDEFKEWISKKQCERYRGGNK